MNVASQDVATPSVPKLPRAAWQKEGIVVVDYMEPLMFRQRMGGWGADVVEEWNEVHTEETIRRLKEMGVTLIITTLHKGFGLKAEAADIEATRKLTAIAHRYGIRVGGYIGATMMYETFFQEEPDAHNWMQVDQRGRPVYYTPQQTWRYLACRNNPGYQAFIRKVLRLGIQDLKLDMMHFDQLTWWPEPSSCHCRYCTEQFQAFLRARYEGPEVKLRFGFPDIADLGPPVFDVTERPLGFAELINPLMQEWARFRGASLARRWGEIDDYIHELNPNVALIGNPNFTFGKTRGFTEGVDPGLLLEHGDGVWDESSDYPAWTSDGRLISKIASYKAARTMGQSLYVYHGRDYRQQSPQILSLAESLAFNDMNLGVIAADDVVGAAVPALSAEAQNYITFFHRHASDLVDTTSVADAAVLNSFPSVEFNPSESNVSTVLFEQTLIQTKIPFAVIFNRHLKELAKYKVLVLADQDALSDEELAAIREFVKNGGGLVATESSSLLTDWRLRRRRFGLADLFGVDVPSPLAELNAPIRRSFGKGRVVYIPRIELSTAPPPPQMNYYFISGNWKLPKNYLELAEAVRWAANRQMSATVNAPLSVAMEIAEQKSSGTRLLHLLNYNVATLVHDLAVSVRLPPGWRLHDIALDSPDGGGRQTLVPSSKRDGIVEFSVPRLKTYDLILLHVTNN
jgi:hypothetical protein